MPFCSAGAAALLGTRLGSAVTARWLSGTVHTDRRPDAMATSDGDRPDVSSRKSDLSLAATLLSLFDFNADGAVTRTEWERGLSTLLLGGLLEDNGLFDQLLERYDTNGTGAIQLNKIRDVLPIDPRISVLMQQLVHSVAGCREYVAAATKKQQRDVEMKSQRAVINLRKRLLSPIFYGWLDAIRADKKVKLKAARFLRNAGLSKAWRTWLDLCDKAAHEARKQKRMGRILKRMQQRGISKALNQWIDVYDERKVRRRTEGPAARRPCAQSSSHAYACNTRIVSCPPSCRSCC